MPADAARTDQLLGRARSLARRGDLAGAARLYDTVLERFPENRRALDGLKALRASREPVTAALQARIVETEWLVAGGQHGPALALASRLAAEHPGSAPVHALLAIVHTAAGRHVDALAAYQRALALQPHLAVTHANLGVLLTSLGRLEDAATSYRNALKLQPGLAMAHNGLGNALRALDRYEEAVPCFERAIRLDPTLAKAHNNLAVTLFELGRSEAAIESYRRAIALEPHAAEFHRNLSAALHYSADTAHLSEMLALRERLDGDDHAAMHLGFALGKAFDDIGDAARAFGHFTDANRRWRAVNSYDPAGDEIQFRGAVALAVAASACERTEEESAGEPTPIFVLGMPRSGTSLLAQMLSSHSRVGNAGELRAMGSLAADLLAAWQKDPSDLPTAPILADIRARYLERLRQAGGGAPFIVDKMPMNFRWIGLILAALPESRIIQITRDPVAVCWSMYIRLFPEHGLDFAYDFETLAHYYRLYAALMAHWHRRYPGRIHVLSYEMLTEAPVATLTAALAHCGLDWEDGCLDFRANARAVQTASAGQVRRGLYKGSSDAWRRYEPWLGDLIAGLSDRTQPDVTLPL